MPESIAGLLLLTALGGLSAADLDADKAQRNIKREHEQRVERFDAGRKWGVLIGLKNTPIRPSTRWTSASTTPRKWPACSSRSVVTCPNACC